MRETRGHTGNRRSHHKIAAPRLSMCSNCNEYHERHHACLNCGQYRGKEILNTGKKETAAVVTTVGEEKTD